MVLLFRSSLQVLPRMEKKRARRATAKMMESQIVMAKMMESPRLRALRLLLEEAAAVEELIAVAAYPKELARTLIRMTKKTVKSTVMNVNITIVPGLIALQANLLMEWHGSARIFVVVIVKSSCCLITIECYPSSAIPNIV